MIERSSWETNQTCNSLRQKLNMPLSRYEEQSRNHNEIAQFIHHFNKLFVPKVSIRTFSPDLARVFEFLEECFPKYTHFLDVGCGDGFPLVIADKLGYLCAGIDKNANALQACRRNLTIAQCREIPLFNLDYRNPKTWENNAHGRRFADFDVFYVWDYAEEASEAIESISEVMRPSSLIMMPIHSDYFFVNELPKILQKTRLNQISEHLPIVIQR